MSKPYLIVAADFVETGGMDVANHALATYLADQGRDVHLVAHSVAEDLSKRANVTVHHVRRPLGSYVLGEPLLDRVGRFWARRIEKRGGHVVVNGGNCQWPDANWVHYVHAAYSPQQAVSAARRLKVRLGHRLSLAGERKAFAQARVVIADSQRTKNDVIDYFGVPAQRVHTIYYGINPDKFRPPTPSERSSVRTSLGWAQDRPMLAFVGALGNRRKGFDTVFAAWEVLCADPLWDVDLVVIGSGVELPHWIGRASDVGLRSRIHFLGFRTDVPNLIAACDALVAPTRYEAYGLAVHEALCCGLPSLVTQTAGVAERYPRELDDLLIPNPDDAADLARRLQRWRGRAGEYQDAVRALSMELRAHTWDHMAKQMVSVIESAE